MIFKDILTSLISKKFHCKLQINKSILFFFCILSFQNKTLHFGSMYEAWLAVAATSGGCWYVCLSACV